jgi:uncharacterized protein YqeY
MLTERLQQDLTAAMRERDELRTATIRMVLTAVKANEVSGTEARALTDEQVVAVLRGEAKKRREAAAAFEAGGRPELAERERAEGAVVEAYLPAELGDDELAALVAAAVEEAGATGPQQLGAVMKLVTPRVAGRADGSRVATEVRRRLAGG